MNNTEKLFQGEVSLAIILSLFKETGIGLMG